MRPILSRTILRHQGHLCCICRFLQDAKPNQGELLFDYLLVLLLFFIVFYYYFKWVISPKPMNTVLVSVTFTTEMDNPVDGLQTSSCMAPSRGPRVSHHLPSGPARGWPKPSCITCVSFSFCRRMVYDVSFGVLFGPYGCWRHTRSPPGRRPPTGSPEVGRVGLAGERAAG